jgi:hypothetical protein
MDTLFLAGDFLGDCVPRDKQYLYRYFKTDLQKQFLRYMCVFDSLRYFTEHTGYVAQRRGLQVLNKKRQMIEAAHRDAKRRMDLELLEKIEKGKYKP